MIPRGESNVDAPLVALPAVLHYNFDYLRTEVEAGGVEELNTLKEPETVDVEEQKA